MAGHKKAEITKFTSRARSLLWAIDNGKTYREWEAAIERAMQRHDWNRHQATVAVCKGYKELKDLYVIFDVKNFDPTPDVPFGTHDVHSTDKQKAKALVKCLDEEMPYREQLRWAVEAAGEFSSHGQEPIECPCWGAYYLYNQARENPKDFLSKLGQAESRVDAEAERSAGTKKSSKRSITEISEMLDELLNDEPKEKEEV